MRRPGLRTAGITALCLAVLAAAAVYAAAGYGSQGSVTVLTTWTGADQRKFVEDVVEPFEKSTGIHVDYQGSSAESQILAADSETGSPPDIAVMPGPGELAGYAARGRLTPLDDMVPPADYAGIWRRRFDGGAAGTHLFWVPVKVDLKSLVWYPGRTMSPADVSKAAKRPAAWCLGMGAAATSGWPGTDWIEDILLQGPDGPALYDALAAGRLAWTSDRVKAAFRIWQSMVGAGRSGRSVHALTTDFADAADSVGKAPSDCTIEHQSTFTRDGAGWRGRSPAYVHSARVIPGASAASTAWEVSGDLAAVFHATPQAVRFLRYMTATGTQRRWNAEGGAGFSADSGVPASAYGDSTSRSLAKILVDPAAEHCWDASDALPPVVRDAFTDAVLRFLADPKALDSQLRQVQAATGLAARQARGGQDTVAFLPSVCARGG